MGERKITMDSNKKKLILRLILATLITGLLVFAIVGGYCAYEEIDYAKHNEYANGHLAERIQFSLTQNALPATFKGMVFAQIPFWLTEIIGKQISADEKKLTIFQLVVTSVISAVIFTALLGILAMARFTFI